MILEKPLLIRGNIAVDDRGSLSFVNDFTFRSIQRFYIVSNHRAGLVRAWHAHRREAKYVTVVDGAAIVCAVPIDDWDTPNREAEVDRHVLSDVQPSVLFIPAGYANGFMSLTEHSKLMFFSTASLDESRSDDIRYDARYWNPWQVIER
jgi:dTDP-4-dehydrorhamnose 3,5-epimerase